MKSIYCKNCKWYQNSGRCYGDRSNIFTERYTDHKGERSSRWKNLESFKALWQLEKYDSDRFWGTRELCTPNKGLDCPIYERKWFKFWIRPKTNVDKLRIMLEGLK